MTNPSRVSAARVAACCILGISFLGLFIGAQTGCQEKGPDVEAMRQRILLKQLPSGVQSLASTEASGELGQVAVVGRIFADQMSPFDAESAIFNLIELPKPGHDHENPGDCPFCRRDMLNAPMATIQVVDESAEIIPVPADQLLGLTENQDVVVQGTARRVGDLIIVDASSVHVLAEDDALNFAKEIHAAQGEPESSSEDEEKSPSESEPESSLEDEG